MYKALYRKYRPLDFNQMIGQDALVMSLKNQIKNNEVSHAYLFSGTRGTGKTSAAKIFARAVNCEHPIDGNPCNKCKSCLSNLNNTSVDVVEMDAASNNGVDDIRDLKDKVIYPPTFLKYKVYIIDEVHMLSKGAFNALLKILEEPPSHLIFILATTEKEKIPATILSRTQKFEFSRVSLENIIKRLKYISQMEGKTLDDEVYLLIAKTSDGAMRDALSVLDQLLSFDSDHISIEKAMDVLGISSSESLFELTSAYLNKDAARAISVIDDIAIQGKDFLSLNNQLLKHMRDLMLVRTLKNPENLVYSTYLKDFKEQAATCDLDNILDIIDELKDLQVNLKYAENPRILLEMTSIKICNKKNFKSLQMNLDNLSKRVGKLEFLGSLTKDSTNNKNIYRQSLEKTNENDIINLNSDMKSENEVLENSSQSDPLSINTEENSDYNRSIDEDKKEYHKNSLENIDDQFVDNGAPEKSLGINDIKKDWNEILNDLKAVNQVPLVGLLNDAKPLSFENGILNICYGPGHEFHLKSTNEPKRLEIIKSVLKKRYGMDIDVKISIADDTTLKKLEDLFGKNFVENI